MNQIDGEGAYFATGADGDPALFDGGDEFRVDIEGRGEVPRVGGTQTYGHHIHFSIDGSGVCDIKDRSEIRLARDVPMEAGDSIYLGFRIKLPTDQPVKEQANYFYLLQLWQAANSPPIFGMRLEVDPSQPSTHHWNAMARTGKDASSFDDELLVTSTAPPRSPFDEIGADLRPGVWHSFVYRFTIGPPTQSSSNGTGSPNANVQIWKDGVIYLGSTDVPMGYWDVPSQHTNKYRIKIGMYKACTAGDHTNFAVDFDEVRLGPTFAAVRPW